MGIRVKSVLVRLCSTLSRCRGVDDDGLRLAKVKFFAVSLRLEGGGGAKKCGQENLK